MARELGRRVRAARITRGMTQAQAGYPLSRAFVSLVERGETLPSLASILWLAGRLGIEVEDLLHGLRALGSQPRTVDDVTHSGPNGRR